ncbi:hypothetical protein GALL_522940 [mine drainage metagenome]|uniref:Uncharacterized protein n=1 Tax=mine drainage metagenome TaxID=410659 RepID=A0A1J5PRD3_9ZZZZ
MAGIGTSRRQLQLDLLDEVDTAEMPRTDVDRNAQRAVARLELRQQLAHAGHHPAVYRHDQVGGFRQRDEYRRWDQAAFRVLPAYQRFGADLHAIRVDLRLQIQTQLVLRYGLMQLLLQLVQLHDALSHRGFKEHDAIAVCGFGLAHGYICMMQYIERGFVRRFGDDADTDTGVEMDQLAFDFDAVAQQIAQFLRDYQYLVAGCLAVGAHARQQQRKHIRIQSRQHVFRAQHLAEMPGDSLERRIAGDQAKSFVDVLEAVDVEQ